VTSDSFSSQPASRHVAAIAIADGMVRDTRNRMDTLVDPPLLPAAANRRPRPARPVLP
jgi:hypothetical protein